MLFPSECLASNILGWMLQPKSWDIHAGKKLESSIKMEIFLELKCWYTSSAFFFHTWFIPNLCLALFHLAHCWKCDDACWYLFLNITMRQFILKYHDIALLFQVDLSIHMPLTSVSIRLNLVLLLESYRTTIPWQVVKIHITFFLSFFLATKLSI